MNDENMDLEPIVEQGSSNGCALSLLGAGLVMCAFYCLNKLPGVAVSLISCVGIAIVSCGLMKIGEESTTKEKQEKAHLEWVNRENARKREIAKTQYDEVCSLLNKPDKVGKLMLKSIKAKLKKKYGQSAIYLNLWLNDDELIFVMTRKCAINTLLFAMKNTLASNVDVHKLKEYIYIIKIPVQNIKFYQKNGEIQRELKITGGGGGGSSIEGAVVGGLIAGEAGAVIGSRKKVDPIKSETVIHDEREVVLYYYENENDEMLQKLTFFEDAYKIFLSWIPEKEYQATVETTKAPEASTNTFTTELLELVKLKDSGILSEAEFAIAKKKILEKP